MQTAYDRCVDMLRTGASYAKPIPSTLDVHIAALRMRIVCDREDILVRCAALKLTLSDV